MNKPTDGRSGKAKVGKMHFPQAKHNCHKNKFLFTKDRPINFKFINWALYGRSLKIIFHV